MYSLALDSPASLFYSNLGFGNCCPLLPFLQRHLVRAKDLEWSGINILWLQLYLLIKISSSLFKHSLSFMFYVLWRLLEELTEKGKTDLL